MVEGEDQKAGNALPLLYFLIQRGLLYYHTKCQGQPCNLLVVPWCKIDVSMHLSHSHPLGGHMGVCNTLAKLRDCFYWPGIEA